MTENQCPCGRPSRDATLCVTCAHQLDDAIAEICDHLAEDLDIALTRQARIDRPSGTRTPAEGDDGRQWPGTLRPTAIPFDPGTSDVAYTLRRILAGWAQLVAEGIGVYSETNRRGIGPVCRRCAHSSCRSILPIPAPPESLGGLARWLRPRVGWLRHHPAAADAYTQILDAVHRARRVIDRPADQLYAGPCDCGEDLYAKLSAAYVECRNHEQPIVWPVEERRRWLLESADDVLATSGEISRALTRYSQPVTESSIRGYVLRGRLTPKGQRTVGKKSTPLYRLGDVLDILARQAERVNA